MAPVTKKSPPAKTASKNEVLKEDEVLQAIVIADSFDNNLKPCTIDTPRALIPLANIPLIDLTLGCLALSGMQDVIIYCNAHAQKIKDHICASHKIHDWPFKVSVVTNDKSHSLGDALRDLDAKQLISGDFILVHGDLVSNLDLKAVLDTHKKIREQDKNAILTKVMKRCPPALKIRCGGDRSVYGLHAKTNQILYHQNLTGSEHLKIPTELFREHKNMQIRYDLMDCHVTACSSIIPSLLTDNFDFATIDDLVHGVLGNSEILGNTMHVLLEDKTYAARVTSLSTYHAVSMDVLKRWAFPFVPDQWEAGACEYRMSNKYLNKNCDIDGNVEEMVLIGENTKIGPGSVVANCVIGSHCVIGSNVTIKNCLIWDHVTIEDGCNITNSILCNSVRVFKDCHIGKNLKESKTGAIIVLGNNVRLGPTVDLNDSIMLVSTKEQCGWSDEWNDNSPAQYGDGAFEYKPDAESKDESEGSEEEDDAGMYDHMATSDTVLFESELMDSLRRAKAEKISADNIILEINSLKAAYNIHISEVNHMLLQTVLHYPVKEFKSDPPKLWKELLLVLKLCTDVFKNYYRSETSQRECLKALQEYAENDENSHILPNICNILLWFYEKDILEETGITKWFEQLPSGPLKTTTQKLIEWFEQAESEDSD